MNTPTEPNGGQPTPEPDPAPHRPNDPPRTPNPMVAFLAREGRADRLLAEHVDDTTGRCAVCTAGPQAGNVRHPCRLHDVAVAALAQIAGRREHG